MVQSPKNLEMAGCSFMVNGEAMLTGLGEVWGFKMISQMLQGSASTEYFCVLCLMAVHCMIFLKLCGLLPGHILQDFLEDMWLVIWLYIAFICCDCGLSHELRFLSTWLSLCSVSV